MNSFGKIFRVTTFGESHGTAIGGVIDGMPAGIPIDIDKIQYELNRRRPGQSSIVTARDEKDRVQILSGLYEGRTTGTPIGFVVFNEDHHSADYSEIARTYRPSHADFTYTSKYGLRDPRGGGRSSARETISRVVAGAFARQALQSIGINIYAYTSQVGSIRLSDDYTRYNPEEIERNIVRCPDPIVAEQMIQLISDVKADGDTIGGVVTGVIKGCPVGLGEPAFDKLHASLGAAMLSINAVKGFDYGMGFEGIENRGSQMLDTFINNDGTISTSSNHSGGIQGGISNGQDIYFRVAFKPVATLLREVETIDSDGNATILKARGRHDPCVLPRAVPIVEAMAAIVILDAYLANKTTHM